MKIKLNILILAVIVLIFSACTKDWENHYDVFPETVNINVWEAMKNDPKISKFVQILADNQADTLFDTDIPFTIFAPTNNAIDEYLSSNEITDVLLYYHISTHFVQSGNIQGKRKVQTLTEKFALFEKYGSTVMIDGITVDSESPLYLNGKYFVLGKVVEPKPSLYEYFLANNNVLSTYIDGQDSIILDKEKSKPLGFDENGNTVYDTVSIIYNKFEYKYFPVKHEFRNVSGTVIFPKADDYNSALDIVAESLGGIYNSHTDIPLDWQEKILIPHLLEQGIFLNMLEPEEFVWESDRDTLKLLNVLGDSIIIDYVPIEKTLCSNGYAYNYQNFSIPDSLYTGGTILEAEWLLEETGINRYNWYKNIKVVTDSPFQPLQELVPTASNDSIIRVSFPKGYTGKYSVEFKSPSLFPRKYVMIVRTHMDIGGIYDIYVNDELVKTFDYYQYVLYRGLMFSVIPGKRYLPTGRFNSFDMYVENLQEYGPANIRFDYKGPGNVVNNGLVIDYIEFVPAD